MMVRVPGAIMAAYQRPESTVQEEGEPSNAGGAPAIRTLQRAIQGRSRRQEKHRPGGP
jgi:hypothetical protein